MDLQTLQQEHEEQQGELRASADKMKKASCEVKTHGYINMSVQFNKWLSLMSFFMMSVGPGRGGASCGAGAHAAPGEGEERSGSSDQGHEWEAGGG